MLFPDPAETCRFYGKRHIPRSHLRVMLALLSGAPGLSGFPLSRLAQAGLATVYFVVWRMERLGWVNRERHLGYAQDGRFTYSLTPKGRAAVTTLLGLQPDSPSWAVIPRA